MNFFRGAAAGACRAETIGVRPEHLMLSRDHGDLRGTAGVSEHLGSDTFVHVRLDDGEQVTARGLGDYRVGHGDAMYLTPDETRIHRFRRDGLALAA